jgi:hypothetical protein
MSRRFWAALALSSLLSIAGFALAGGAAGRGLHATSQATVAPLAYSETQTCAGCPSDTRLDSVEVQARQTSTLFILRGHWPESIDAFHVDVCLNVNDIGVTLIPHGSRKVFEPTIIQRTPSGASTSVAASSVAVGLQDGSLLIDLSGSARPAGPLRFDVAVCRGAEIEERLPQTGELVWDGHGAPHR